MMASLSEQDELFVINDKVGSDYEVSALLSLVDDRAAVVMTDVDGLGVPVFGNLLSSRERIALALGVPVCDVLKTLTDSVKSPIAPVLIEDAPVQQKTVTEDMFSQLPVPTFFTRESGPYISAGLMVAKDPETGKGNASYARLKVLGPDTAMIGIAPNHHLAIMAQKAAARGEALELAVVLGAHPAIQLAACLYLGLGDDELHNAGALLGEPVRMTKAKTLSLEVPAEAEIILEGHIHVDQLIKEGPVSEYHGMYEDYGHGFLVTFSCMTRRNDAMLQVIEPGYHMEHSYIAGVPIAASLKANLSRAMQNVGEVAVTTTGSGRNNVVVQLHNPRPGQARRAMNLCWGAVSIIKNVTVVDSDVDPWDLQQVELAKLNRMKSERDILIIENLPGDRSEAQEMNGLVTKVGYDATCKDGDRGQGYDKAVPPVEVTERMQALLKTVRPDFKP
ncbi:UbiD family decarboxylase [uncultured Cohaesibacter sp.]|uniref:UbiD family decarboxylase n=1 Tax=uncultured Cohaesibacter sp. TaxID=1002546 RepID=UPI0029C85084|nr:UbiD family decarboxylase [uncultured Cohaesibacter sp.]